MRRGLVAAAALFASTVASSARADALRWTAPTTDAMAELAAAHARRAGYEGLAGVAILHSLADGASYGLVERLLADIGKGNDDVAEQARWVLAELDRKAPAPGLVGRLALLGPFADTEGHLRNHQVDFDEAAPRAWTDRTAKLDWGRTQVRWRDVPMSIDGRGVPLDVLLSPRLETCAYVASYVTFEAAEPVTVSVASTGSVRLGWDAADLGFSEAQHASAIFDRLANRFVATAGKHVVSAKVCTGPHADHGRVRLRITRQDGRAAHFTSSPVLGPVARVESGLAVSPLETAAERALTTAANAKGDARVALIALLTAGKLDDERSPRSSAYVDAIIADPSSSPDAIAMASMLSTFPAVRASGLRVAIDRARAVGDAATMDFAERQLVASRLASGYGDWAVAGLGAEPLVRATDVDAKALRASTLARGDVVAARRRGLTDLELLTATRGAAAPIALLEALANAAHGLDPAVERRARALLGVVAPGRDAAAYVEAASTDGAKAMTAIAFDEMGLVDEGYALDRIGEALAQTNRFADRAAFARLAILVNPNRAASHHQLAEALFSIGGDAAKGEGLGELARANDLSSEHHRAKDEVALRTGKAPQVLRDERGLEAPATFLARAAATPAIAGQFESRTLELTRVITLLPDRHVTELMHYAREITLPPTSDADLVETVSMAGRSFDVLRARVHKKGGGVAFAEEERSDRTGVHIKWPDLAPGDVVEVVVRAHRPVSGGRGDAPLWVVAALPSLSNRPLLHARVIVESPKKWPLAIDVLNAQPDETKRTSDERHVTVAYTWSKLPTFDDEPFAPDLSEFAPVVVASRHATWTDFRRWYQAATQGFSDPDVQIRELATKLTTGKGTRDEKIRALFDFVADDIRYVNYISGEAWLPNRPQQLLARRQGDCDDKATLLISLLKAIGVDATLALVQTRLHPRLSLIGAKNAVIPVFDHGIAYVPARGGEKALWLDATSPESRVGPLPAMDLRTPTFFINEGEPALSRAPLGTPADHGYDATWNIELAADGSATVEASDVARGGAAHAVRSALREHTNRASWIEEHLTAERLPQVAVDPDVKIEPDLPNGEAKLTFHAKSASLGRRERGELVVKLAGASTLSSRYATLPTRTLPLVLPYYMAPRQDVNVVRIAAPAGMVPGPLPARVVEDGGSFGRASYDAKIDPKNARAVVVTISIANDLDVIPAARYAEYRAWLGRVDALRHRELRFVPKTSASR